MRILIKDQGLANAAQTNPKQAALITVTLAT